MSDLPDLAERYYSRELKRSKLKRNLKFYLILALIIFILFAFGTGLIVIQFTFEEENTNIVFSLINALIWGVYLNGLGFSLGISKSKWKILMILLLLIFYLWFSAYLGIRVIINYIPLFYNHFATNTPEGAFFFAYNSPIFIVIFLISLGTEGEI